MKPTLNIVAALQFLESVNSLFDFGCEVSLCEDQDVICITGYDSDSRFQVAETGNSENPLQSAVIERNYCCGIRDPDTGDFDTSKLTAMLLSIKGDNESVNDA